MLLYQYFGMWIEDVADAQTSQLSYDWIHNGSSNNVTIKQSLVISDDNLNYNHGQLPFDINVGVLIIIELEPLLTSPLAIYTILYKVNNMIHMPLGQSTILFLFPFQVHYMSHCPYCRI